MTRKSSVQSQFFSELHGKDTSGSVEVYITKRYIWFYMLKTSVIFYDRILGPQGLKPHF